MTNVWRSELSRRQQSGKHTSVKQQLPGSQTACLRAGTGPQQLTLDEVLEQLDEQTTIIAAGAAAASADSSQEHHLGGPGQDQTFASSSILQSLLDHMQATPGRSASEDAPPSIAGTPVALRLLQGLSLIHI